jgi:predicted Rossmann-fold nucleotide-binding protein
VDGFTFLARVQRSVTFFGSARLPTTHPYYQLARENAALADAYSAYIDHLMAKY